MFHTFVPCFSLTSLSSSLSDETEQVWVWQYESEDGTHDLFMDINEEIRFKVVDEVFVDTTPVGPEDLAEPVQDPLLENQPKKSPYSLVVSVTIIQISMVQFIGSDDDWIVNRIAVLPYKDGLLLRLKASCVVDRQHL